MHVASGDISDVSIVENDFVINIQDDYLYDIIKEGSVIIEDALSYLGYELKLRIEKKEKVLSMMEQDKQKLLNFIDKLNIKGDK